MYFNCMSSVNYVSGSEEGWDGMERQNFAIKNLKKSEVKFDRGKEI